MKSIMQDRKECYLCRRMYMEENVRGLEEHHCIHGTAGRKLAERYGLKVWLCYQHHRTGKTAVHTNKKMDLLLQQKAQSAFEDRYSHEEFVSIFGRNYL